MTTCHITDSRLYGTTFASTKVASVFSDRNRVRKWFDIEPALALAQGELWNHSRGRGAGDCPEGGRGPRGPRFDRARDRGDRPSAGSRHPGPRRALRRRCRRVRPLRGHHPGHHGHRHGPHGARSVADPSRGSRRNPGEAGRRGTRPPRYPHGGAHPRPARASRCLRLQARGVGRRARPAFRPVRGGRTTHLRGQHHGRGRHDGVLRAARSRDAAARPGSPRARDSLDLLARGPRPGRGDCLAARAGIRHPWKNRKRNLQFAAT